MGKRTKKLGDRSRSKKKRSLTGDYQENTRRNSFMDGEAGSMRGKGRGDGMKIGPSENIPQNEEP